MRRARSGPCAPSTVDREALIVGKCTPASYIMCSGAPFSTLHDSTQIHEFLETPTVCFFLPVMIMKKPGFLPGTKAPKSIGPQSCRQSSPTIRNEPPNSESKLCPFSHGPDSASHRYIPAICLTLSFASYATTVLHRYASSATAAPSWRSILLLVHVCLLRSGFPHRGSKSDFTISVSCTLSRILPKET